MLFRNVVLYRLPADWSLPAANLEDTLAARPLRPCGAFEMETRGFVTLGPEERFLYTQGPHHLMMLGSNRKLLPASIVNQEAKARAAEQAKEQGHPVGRRQMKEIRARVDDELRARALTRRTTTAAWLDAGRRWLAINAAARGRAEGLAETLRDTLGSLPVLPVEAPEAPTAAFATWLTRGDPPGRFAIGEDVELKAFDNRAADNRGATIRYVRHPLDGKDVRDHLATGMLPTRLGLVWNERISFVLHQDLRITGLRFLDVYKDDNAKGEDAAEQFAIDFALMTGEVSQLLDELMTALGIDAAAAPRTLAA